MELIPGSNDKLLWGLNNLEMISINKSEKTDFSFSVPIKATLQKVK